MNEQRIAALGERWPALMTRAEAALYLSCSVSEITSMKARGEIQSVKPRANAQPKYRKSDLDEYIMSLEVGDGTCNAR